jgi:hypothetical protein
MFDCANRTASVQRIKHEQFSGVHVVKFRTEARFTPSGFVECGQGKVLNDGSMSGSEYLGPQTVILCIPMLGRESKRQIGTQHHSRR